MDPPGTLLPPAMEPDLASPEGREQAVKRANQLARAGNHVEADRLFLAAARAESPTGMAFYGARLIGRGELNERAEAIEWLERAIRAGESTIAPLTLGSQLLRGKNVPQDRERGLQLLGLSARSGSSLALRLLVRAHATGRFGVARDHRAAALWLATKAPAKYRWGIYLTHYLGLAPLRDRIARPLILQMSREARRWRRMSQQQIVFEAQRKRADMCRRQREQARSSQMR
jgi:TPR repeat protein